MGALQILWSLRVINAVGMLPVLLAVLSPIGGQASLQMLATRDKSEITHVPITYLTTGECDGLVITGN